VHWDKGALLITVECIAYAVAAVVAAARLALLYSSLLPLHHTRSEVWNPRSKIFNLTVEDTDSYYINCIARVLEYVFQNGRDMMVLM
jgi:hypothetical protein